MGGKLRLPVTSTATDPPSSGWMVAPVLVSLGCHNKVPQPTWLTQQSFIPHSEEVEKSKIEVPASRFDLRPLIVPHRHQPSSISLCSHDLFFLRAEGESTREGFSINVTNWY